MYFTDGKPLDTDNINECLTALMSLELADYVSYNVTDEELQTFGLDEPALTITLDYSSSDADGTETDSGTLVLHLSAFFLLFVAAATEFSDDTAIIAAKNRFGELL